MTLPAGLPATTSVPVYSMRRQPWPSKPHQETPPLLSRPWADSILDVREDATDPLPDTLGTPQTTFTIDDLTNDAALKPQAHWQVTFHIPEWPREVVTEIAVLRPPRRSGMAPAALAYGAPGVRGAVIAQTLGLPRGGVKGRPAAKWDRILRLHAALTEPEPWVDGATGADRARALWALPLWLTATWTTWTQTAPWVAAGFEFPDTAALWATAFTDPTQAYPWSVARTGLGPATCAVLADSGWTPADVTAAHQAPLDDYANRDPSETPSASRGRALTALSWHTRPDSGPNPLTVAQAIGCIRAGLQPAEIEHLRTTGNPDGLAPDRLAILAALRSPADARTG